MRREFAWYLRPNKGELDAVCSEGCLTVDANVLLDLYRYHATTRAELQKAVDSFGDRVWLSRQAAEEFIRNRTKVIVSSQRTFQAAEERLEALQGSVNGALSDLRSNRLLSRDDLDALDHGLRPLIEGAKARVAAAQAAHPDYLSTDPILDWVLNRFEGRLGPAPGVEELRVLHKEAQDRISAKIPPGYSDSDKDGARPYGDFMFWSQTLARAKEAETSFVVVTSERKEDWWEKQAGRTVGPRSELLREAYETAGQRVLIYHTEQFLKIVAERSGAELNQEAVEEVREVSGRRVAETEPAIRVTLVSELESNSGAEGLIKVDVLRPIHNFTCTARPPLPAGRGEPTIRTHLVSSPPEKPQTILRSRLGQFNDLNIHLHSGEHGSLLPEGEYILKYEMEWPPEVARTTAPSAHACIQCGRTDAWSGTRCLNCNFNDDE